MFGQSKKLRRQRLKEDFGKNPFKENNDDNMDKIGIYHEEILKNNEEDLVDDITWNDLEMDKVFKRINNTKSYIGEQVLYHNLHKCNASGEWHNYENQIFYLTDNENQRIEIEEKLLAIGKRNEDYYLPSFLFNPESWKVKNSFLLHLLQLLLVIFIVLAIIKDNIIFTGGLVIVIMINFLIYFSMKQKYEGYLYSLGSLKQILEFSRWMVKDEERRELFSTEEVIEAVEELQGLSKLILRWQGRKYASMSGDLMGLCGEYLMGITLCDIAVFNHIMRIIDKKQDKVLRILEFTGTIDQTISVASFRKSEDTWCCPEFWNNHGISGEGIGHPLIEKPVLNDFTLNNRAIITGANASGKSTFMKAMAINVILSQTIHTAIAASFKLPGLKVMTSMSLRDDILSHESYYIREAKYLRRMLEGKRGKVPVLCVIDEMLKGTNTTERLAASSAILEYFMNVDNYVLVATHDMELVYDMKDKYENYYFESQVTDKDIKFDYHIHRGVGGSSNAIALLSLLNFPQRIIFDAKYKLERGIK